MNQSTSRAAVPVIALVTILLSVTTWWVLPSECILRWFDEGALVEDLTIALYLTVALWLLLTRGPEPTRVVLALVLTMVAFAAREAHWHIQFTSTSMLRVSYYLGPAPALHKAGSLFALGILFLAWTCLLRSAMQAWHAHRLQHGSLGLNMFTFISVLAATKLLDRMVSVLSEELGVDFGPAARGLQLALEESLEMALPVMLWAAACQYRAHIRRAAASRELTC